MSRFLKHEVVRKILDIGLLPVFCHKDVEVSQKIVKACVDGGATVVEFTNRGDFAHDVFNKLLEYTQKELPDVILGIGTILDPAIATMYINCGTNFVVGPIFNLDIAKVCNRRKIAYIPGCMTPTEISTTEKMGVDIVKIFPGITVGPEFIKSVLGPCPLYHMMPSGGVETNQENISTWIKAGSSALNIGSNLIRKDLVNSKDFNSIKKLVSQCIMWIDEARKTH
jgi:2-dehydro-3-deoxyphosphogluconate aldolase / (4S)-4-hydroxy-2-oxoglutarate aldolase